MELQEEEQAQAATEIELKRAAEYAAKAEEECNKAKECNDAYKSFMKALGGDNARVAPALGQ